MPAHRTKENQGIFATESRYTMEGMARGKKKKKKPPKKKAPNKKEKPLLAAPLAYGRLRRPPLSLLFSLPSAAAPPHLFASPLALLSGGCAARPLPLLFRFSSASSAAAPPLSPPRSRGRLAPLPLPLHYEIASLRDAHGDRYSSIPRLRKSEIFLSGVIEIEPLRGLFCYRHMS